VFPDNNSAISLTILTLQGKLTRNTLCHVTSSCSMWIDLKSDSFESPERTMSEAKKGIYIFPFENQDIASSVELQGPDNSALAPFLFQSIELRPSRKRSYFTSDYTLAIR